MTKTLLSDELSDDKDIQRQLELSDDKDIQRQLR